MDRESSHSSQGYTQTVSYTGSGHGKLPLSVFSLLADEVEGVDICSSTQQTLIEDYSKHQPGTGQELVTHCEQKQHCIHHLQQSESPQFPDLHAAQGGSRHEHTDLIQRLIPAILLCMGQEKLWEIQEFHQALVNEVFSKIDQAQRKHKLQQASDDMQLVFEGERSSTAGLLG